jgi:hypothetical protein
MQEDKLNKRLKKTAVISVILFITSYIIFLLLWITVKQYYGNSITFIATHAVTVIKDVDIEGILSEENTTLVSFVPQRHEAREIIDITINTNSYTFNAPLTFAIMAAFYPYVRRKRIYFEVLLILMAVHVLYVFSLQGTQVTDTMISLGYEQASTLKAVFWGFLWQFVDNMVIRFEPFLLGAYIFFRKEHA